MIGCVLLFLCVFTEAQEYVNLTAQQLRIDSLLPVYTYQKQLGSHYADSLWHVSIEYPLFTDMSREEVRRYQQVCGEPLPAWPEVSQSVEVARKQGVLEVSFVPLVFRDRLFRGERGAVSPSLERKVVTTACETGSFERTASCRIRPSTSSTRPPPGSASRA